MMTPFTGQYRSGSARAGARSVLIAVAALMATPLVARADDDEAPPEVIRPAFQLRRYRENWSGLAGWDRTKTGDFWDPIKYVPLSDDGSIWASFGGHVRNRYEVWNNFGFGGAGPREDSFLLTRLVLHGDLHVGDHLRVFAEGKSSLSTYDDLPGGKRTSDEDTIDLEQLFVDLKIPLENDQSLTVRPGRQVFLFGKQRLVSPLPWSNTMRRWDGVSAMLDLEGGWNVKGFWSHFVPVRKYDFNDPDSQTHFWGVYATGPLATTPFGLDLYLLGLNRYDPVTFNGTTGDEDRYTLGGRIWGTVKDTGFDFDVEGAYQFGEVGSDDVSAFMFATELGHQWTRVAGKPRVHAGFDYASGDDDPGGDVETFNPLFPLGHAFLGYIDTIGRQNVIQLTGGVTVQPIPQLTLRLAGHAFWRAETEDAVYNAGGSVVRAGSLGNQREIGSEIDLTVKYVFDRHLTGEVGYSHFFSGEFIDNTGAHKDIDFFYVSFQYKF